MDLKIHVTVHAYAEEQLHDEVLVPHSGNYGILGKEIVASLRRINGKSFSIRNDDRLAAALAALLREKRDVILLSYFMDMSDREIGELLDMARRTVQHRRTDTLAELRKRMEDGDD